MKVAMVDFLKENPGVRLVVASPGARPDIPNVKDLFVKEHGRVWKAQRDGNCLFAALTNAIDITLGRDDARHFFNKAQGAALSCPRVSSVLFVFQRLKVRLEARKLSKEMRATMTSQPCQTLASARKGVFIAFLEGPAVHCVVVDADRALI